ncbi:MAG: hypothetical protein H6739_06115 [Alphaproteobacteria bacterium]|nr:hypothetical protein [Alphaproteobacteria bacterium]
MSSDTKSDDPPATQWLKIPTNHQASSPPEPEAPEPVRHRPEREPPPERPAHDGGSPFGGYTKEPATTLIRREAHGKRRTAMVIVALGVVLLLAVGLWVLMTRLG